MCYSAKLVKEELEKRRATDANLRNDADLLSYLGAAKPDNS